MPTVSEFNGIKIKINHEADEKHSEPHFHAYYGNHKAVFSIVSFEVLASTHSFPSRTAAEVRQWAIEHRKQLKKNWYRAKYRKPITKI